MASFIANTAKKKLLDGDIDLLVDTIKVMLTTSSYTPNVDTHEFISSVTNEVVGTGYVAGGAALASKTTTADTTDDEGVFDAADLTWSTSTITARYAVIYKDTGVAGTSAIIAVIDFGTDKVSTGGNFTITWNAEGIINLN